MTTPDRLAEIAVELAVRVRDDDPEANGRWLAAQLPDPTGLRNLCIVLAAAVPDDRPWTELVAWTDALTGQPSHPGPPTPPARTRRLQPCGTRAAYRRHRRAGEQACQPCKDAAARHKRDASRKCRTQPDRRTA